MRPRVCAVIAALATALAGGWHEAAAACVPLLPRPPASYIVPGAQEFVYATPPGGAPLLLDAFAQPDGKVHPAVLVIHGGGWTTGSRVAHIGQFLELLTEAGYQWVAIDYRLGGAGRWQEAADDVRTAIAFIGCHARALHIDPTRLVVLGEDVGAQLAVHAATGGGVGGIALVGGVYAQAPRLPGVPTLAVHGGADTEVAVGQVREFCDRIVAFEGTCELDVVDGAIHRAENWRPSQWHYKPRLVAWLRRVLGAGAARPLAFAPQPVRDVFGPGLHKRLIYNARTGMTFDAWVPAGAGPHVPVLLVHGGGWEAGDRVTYITPLFAPLADAGLAWFSMDYRLTPDATNAGQLQDLRDAIAFLRQRAGSFNIDARKLVIVGESASGQMVAQIGAEDASLAGVISFYGVYDFLPMAANLTPRSAVTRLFGITHLDDQSRATLRTYSPLHSAHKDQPPLLLVNGTGEGLWAQGQAMAAHLQAIGARHQMLALDGAPHGMENWEGQPQWQHYKARVVEWIGRVTGGRK
ncbi:MAG: alpha/beta hydrolase [Vicinamibacteria bacterium]|nr:alpha/beta hydrolase [Vicinamibacteria bacterium]